MMQTRQIARPAGGGPGAALPAPAAAQAGNQARLRRLAASPEPAVRLGPSAAPSETAADQAAEALLAGRRANLAPAAGAEEGPVASEGVLQALAGMGPGAALPDATRTAYERRLGRSLADVRVHSDAAADRAARSVSAEAFALGPDIAFAAGRYQPRTRQGQALLAHELAHVAQAPAGATLRRKDHYTPAERAEMTSGKVVAQQADKDMAKTRGFEPGDIVFRKGSTILSKLIGEPMTHGGIYLGEGLIHDVVAMGNRNVRVTNFYDTTKGEAADGAAFKVLRFKGPEKDLVLGRLLGNIARRDFDMPTGPVPFNLFSSANDYKTATCLEYAHAQFLYAIRQLAADPGVPADKRDAIRKAYFKAGAARPSALIKPKTQRLIGNTVEPSMGAGLGGGMGGAVVPQRSLSALAQEGGLVAAANAMATDADTTRMMGVSESTYRQVYAFDNSTLSGMIKNALFGGMLYDETALDTYTYQSFKDATAYFEDKTPTP